jgi:hypothetical protein
MGLGMKPREFGPFAFETTIVTHSCAVQNASRHLLCPCFMGVLDCTICKGSVKLLVIRVAPGAPSEYDPYFVTVLDSFMPL